MRAAGRTYKSVGKPPSREGNTAMNEKPVAISPESIDANARLLEIFSDDKRHHEATMMNVMIVFVSANAALLAAELLARTIGPMALGSLGIASVVISALAVWKSRYWWGRVMHRGFEVQCGLRDSGVHLFAHPFGDSPASEGMGTTDLVHAVVLIFWILYLVDHNAVQLVLHFFNS